MSQPEGKNILDFTSMISSPQQLSLQRQDLINICKNMIILPLFLLGQSYWDSSGRFHQHLSSLMSRNIYQTL